MIGVLRIDSEADEIDGLLNLDGRQPVIANEKRAVVRPCVRATTLRGGDARWKIEIAERRENAPRATGVAGKKQVVLVPRQQISRRVENH